MLWCYEVLFKTKHLGKQLCNSALCQSATVACGRYGNQKGGQVDGIDFSCRRKASSPEHICECRYTRVQGSGLHVSSGTVGGFFSGDKMFLEQLHLLLFLSKAARCKNRPVCPS